jgi:site-specific recombinase XerC
MYYRAPGKKALKMPDTPIDSPFFLRTYAELLDADAPKIHQTANRGSIARAISEFQASTEFASRATSTQRVWAGMYRDISDRYGTARLTNLKTTHIRKDLARLEPHPANNRLKAWRSFCNWTLQAGQIENNPARDVTKRATPKTDGHIPWTRADVEAFRARWPHDTLQRMAFELMHWTTCAVSDAAKMLRTDIDHDGWLTYARQKTGTVATCPFYAESPEWAESNAQLIATMDAQQSKHVSMLVTAHGKPRSAKAMGSWFSNACTDAGLPELSAHGIKKHRSAVFKENGALPEKRMAWMGHETEEEATNYSRSADLRKTITGTNNSNSPTEVFQPSTKTPLK